MVHVVQGIPGKQPLPEGGCPVEIEVINNAYELICCYCGGHHDSDRTAVLVWSPRLKLLYCKYHQFMYTLPNKDFLPSFLPSYALNTTRSWHN